MYYGIDENQRTVEFGEVSAARAIEICRERIPRGFDRFETDGAALAATMFGFSVSEHLFVELSANGTAGVSLRFEWARGNWLRRMFGGTLQIDRTLVDPEAVVDVVREFFAREPQDYVRWLSRSGGG